MNSIRVGAIQFKPAFLDNDKNIRKIKEFLTKAWKLEIDLAVLPELSNSGYNFKDLSEVQRSSEKIPEGPSTKMLIEIAREYSMYVVMGINETSNGKYYNSAIFVGPEGYLGVYRKVHLFYNEKDFFERGKEFRVFNTKIGKIGIMICFDWIFPESARTLALKGAEIIAHPANLVLPYWQKMAPLRALENRVYIVTANRIGIERDLRFTGWSIIVNPSGERISEASKTHEEIIYADIDLNLARNKKITEKNHIFEDRLPSAYDL